MTELFSVLYYTVFPFCGRFLGQIAALAQIPTGRMIEAFGGSYTVYYTNLFTGEQGLFNLWLNIGEGNNWGMLLAVVVAPVKWVWNIFLNVFNVSGDLPLWCGLLILIATGMIFIGFVKFVKNVFTIF